MGRVGEEQTDFKTQLVLEIISVSSRSIACPHQHSHKRIKSPLVDWYRLLRAYACLSDDVKRRTFDSERWRSFCRDCNRIPYTACNPSANSGSAKLKPLNPTNWSRYYKVFRGLRDIRDRLKEEARVIENCFKTNAASREEFPLFNPSDYQFQGYPHHRPLFYKKTESLWYLPGSRVTENYLRSNVTSRKESPLFNPSDYLHQGYPHYRTRSYQKPGIW
uniref:J domain-containing protein n=1 Tax=Vitis vinifera TaxID=29760 RepID=F6H6V8_VITVI